MTWCWYVVLMIVDYTRFTLFRIWLMFFLCAVLFFRFIVSVFAFWIQYAFLVIFPSQAKGKILTRLDVQVVTRNVAPASGCLFSSSNDAKMIYFLGFLFRSCTWQRISSLYWMLCELQMFWKYRYISKNVFWGCIAKVHCFGNQWYSAGLMTFWYCVKSCGFSNSNPFAFVF